ncbi:phosphatase PAP2 family protein [Candidatus Roizmanbacteria bacterium]|nr:phosphatase PAP2 family protein [Candidatus Roizmanbacteria bacterium]
MVNSLDSWLTSFIYSIIPHNQFFDYFFTIFSQTASSLPVWITILIILFIFAEVKDRRFLFFVLLVFFLSSIIVTPVLKTLTKKPRPCHISAVNKYPCPSDFSFPSGHATTSFAIATVFSLFDKKRRYLYYIIAGLIGLSRIYLGIHYLFDVVAGAIIGYTISKTILAFLKKLSTSSHRH